MHRMLALDVEVLEQGTSSTQGGRDHPRFRWLVDALRSHPDVRIVLLALRDRFPSAVELQCLDELAERMMGSTLGLLRGDALVAALRFNMQGAVHLVVVADEALVPEGDFDTLVCDSLEQATPTFKSSLEQWLSRTRPTALSTSIPSQPRGKGLPVLYLDFDGVLHHENVLRHPRRGIYAGPPGFELFEHAALLEQLLEPHPLVRIVLSTSWVRAIRFSRSVKWLPRGLQDRVIGATYHSEMNEQIFAEKPRGQQVLEDVARRRPLHWLVLDDTDEGWPSEVRDNVLITNERLGIAEPGMPERIAAALKRMR